MQIRHPLKISSSILFQIGFIMYVIEIDYFCVFVCSIAYEV